MKSKPLKRKQAKRVIIHQTKKKDQREKGQRYEYSSFGNGEEIGGRSKKG